MSPWEAFEKLEIQDALQRIVDSGLYVKPPTSYTIALLALFDPVMLRWVADFCPLAPPVTHIFATQKYAQRRCKNLQPMTSPVTRPPLRPVTEFRAPVTPISTFSPCVTKVCFAHDL